MNIIVLGPQASGKGTQAQLLAKKYGFDYFSAGDFLRDLAKTNQEVARTINEGKLIPDDEMFRLVREYFEEKKDFDNILLDGFPRSITQYKLLKEWLGSKGLKIDLVFLLQISEKETIKRLSARRADPKTGKIYNLITNPPPPEVDVTKLVVRDDDRPKAIKERLEVYHKITAPLVNILKDDGILVEINGERSIDAIHKDIVGFIEKKK